MELSTNQERLLERLVVGVERLAEDPVVEIESGPPICPHCNRVNPIVDVNEGGGRGRLYECFIVARCAGCHEEFYVVPMHIETFTSKAELEEEILKRKGSANGS